MSDSGIKFYQVFGFNGTIGVNTLSFSDILMGNFLGLIFTILIFGAFAFVFPLFMLLMYGLLVLVGNWEQMQLDRVRANIFSILGYIYFMIDYHFGFIGWSVFNTLFGAEFVDKLCYINTALFLLNVILMFAGNRIFNQIQYGFMRLIIFGGILFLSSKVLLPIGEALSPSITKQYVPKPGEEIKKTIDYIDEPPYDGSSFDE